MLVVDERVAERFTASGGPVDRMMYCCLPTAMVERPTAATGTVMRADTLRRYADEGDLIDVEVLPVENDLFRLYRLRP